MKEKKKETRSETLTIRVPKSIRKELDEISKKQDRSINEIINTCILQNLGVCPICKERQ